MLCLFNLAFLTLLHPRAAGHSTERPIFNAKVSSTEDPPSYLELPVFLHYRVPLIDKNKFTPVSGTGHEQLPDKIREILLPMYPTQKPSNRPSQAGEVITLCNVNKMHVQVKKSILGSRGSPSKVTLGTCQANKSTKDSLFFEYDLGLCGSERSIVNNRVAYSNSLRYDPPKIQGPIRRSVPFTMKVVCLFNRYHYAYKIGYTPKVKVQTFSKQMTEKNSILLTARNAQWARLGPSEGFYLGKSMYFQAEAPSMSTDRRLYVHSCHVTLKRSHTSMPQYTVIDNLGCMVESKNHRGSRFVPYKRSAVRFSVDAFLFQGMTAVQPQQLYMHCAVSVGRSVPSSTAKACNYDAKARGWKELYGASSVCSCCDSKCTSAVPSTTPKMVSSKPWSLDYNTTPALTQEVWTTTEAEVAVHSGRGKQMGRPKTRPVKGFAVVDEQVSEPHRTFEEIFGLEK
ncbi:zona pellucida sperm-binding protein 3d.2 [Esox lucius]|uniref:zona pellucida sperm-binding protein 3d.2 n=1 Tax=Esox lucius TaxID=8010 RepID=UPI001476B417|nr:zona pellucida sperm-binding protein 3d.2 [Esox lucius]